MASMIDPTVPATDAALTSAPLRSNFAIAQSEISALQAATVTAVTMGGDVTGTSNAAVVGRLQNGVVLSGTPAAGNVLTATAPAAATWSAPAVAGITGLTGDVTASGPGAAVATVARLQGGIALSGAPANGQVLTAASPTAANWQTPAVTTQVTMAGDVTGVSNAAVVGRLQNGVALSGTPANGQVLTATGPAAATWQAPAVAGITVLTGDVTAAGPGAVPATVARLQNGIALSGTPSAGQVLTATGATGANWATPASATLATYLTTTAAGGVYPGTPGGAQVLPTADFINVTGGTGGVIWNFTTPAVGQAVRTFVHNSTGTAIEFYPKTGAAINNLAVNQGVGGIPPNTTGAFWAVSATQIFTVP